MEVKESRLCLGVVAAVQVVDVAACDALDHAIADVGAIVMDTYVGQSLTCNLKPGKSSVMVRLCGAGSRAAANERAGPATALAVAAHHEAPHAPRRRAGGSWGVARGTCPATVRGEREWCK